MSTEPSIPPHLLYVEDDGLMRRTLARVLREHVEHLQLAANVAEARALVAQRPWCGFIADHRLPDGSGLDLLVELGRSHPGVPAMLVTGERDVEIARRCAAAGLRYLPKPFRPEHCEPFFADVERFLGA